MMIDLAPTSTSQNLNLKKEKKIGISGITDHKYLHARAN
jgi:hypothetical protein